MEVARRSSSEKRYPPVCLLGAWAVLPAWVPKDRRVAAVPYRRAAESKRSRRAEHFRCYAVWHIVPSAYRRSISNILRHRLRIFAGPFYIPRASGGIPPSLPDRRLEPWLLARRPLSSRQYLRRVARKPLPSPRRKEAASFVSSYSEPIECDGVCGAVISG